MSIEQEKQKKGEVYAKFGDFRRGHERVFAPATRPSEHYAIRELAKLCWERRKELLNDNHVIRRSSRTEIASEVLKFLKTEPDPALLGELESLAGEARIIAEHLIDTATQRACALAPSSDRNQLIGDQAYNRMMVRSETLISLGAYDLYNACRKSELALDLVVSQIAPQSPPEPGMTV